jgi:hypothetical protein
MKNRQLTINGFINRKEDVYSRDLACKISTCSSLIKKYLHLNDSTYFV